MAQKLKIYVDPIANTMNIWWDDPAKAYSSEEVDSPYSNDVIVKDKKGVPISLEIIGVFPEELNIIKLLKEKYPTLNKNAPFAIETKEN